MLAFQREQDEDAVVYRRPRPHVIEDDEEEEDAPPQQQLVRPSPVRLVRPVALKVICPIPKKAVEEFYDEAYRQGIAGTEIHAATAIAQDWHRKWTQQDEEGHTMPESTQDALIPEHYAYNPLDRNVGAKNPSPEDVHSEYERKRMRYNVLRSYSSISDSPSEEDESDDSSDSPIIIPLQKRPAHHQQDRQFQHRRLPNNSQGPHPPPQTQGHPGLVRPVALRVMRPAMIIPPEEFTGAIPQHIMNQVRQGYQQQLSPLTIPSAVNSHRSPKAMSPVGLDQHMYDFVPSVISHPRSHRSCYGAPPEMVREARRELLHALAAAGGDVGQGAFDLSLKTLADYFTGLDIDTRPADSLRPTEGLWLTLTKPSFFGNLGDNDNGDPMYTLSRMAFDMFSPTNLVCSLQGNFNIVKPVPLESRSALLDSVPTALKEEVEDGATAMRTYE
mmetsp:Transcript_17546/g.35303  ORF Transcript_17546/g.35303 Transcript_17546/m.35303 type:complete len:444 (+) Transcript_17546:124-1455(+)